MTTPLRFFGTVILLVAALCVSGCGKKSNLEEPGADPEAVLQNAAMNARNLAELMTHHSKHSVTPQPWVGYWFPYRSGGTAAALSRYDEAYVNSMKAQGVDMSGYQPAVGWERIHHGPGVATESWFGHCNGWTASAILVPEPRAPKSAHGVKFEIGHQKALLAESYLEFSGDFIGSRVNDKGDFSSARFWDITPAQFHLILSNIMSKQNRGIIIDRHTGDEIWNQPLVGYSFNPIKSEDYLGVHPQFPEIYRVNVTARIWWGNDNVGQNEITPPFDMAKLYDKFFDHYFPGRKLKYELWLDGPAEFDGAGKLVRSGDILITNSDGRYVGGIWKNGSAPEQLINTHPDYMWVPFGRQFTSGYKNPRINDLWVRDNIARAYTE